jgi:predicted phosphoadenosine phosphosulfate sulfurtransferase
MARSRLGKSVYEAVKERIAIVMRNGHRVIVTFSGSKDSTVCLNLAPHMAVQDRSYRLVLLFTGAEAETVKKALGSDSRNYGHAILDLCRNYGKQVA